MLCGLSTHFNLTLEHVSTVSTYIRDKIECWTCPSSDAVAEYDDHFYCFACEAYKSKEQDESFMTSSVNPPETPKKESLADRNLLPLAEPGATRGISVDILKKYGVGTTLANSEDYVFSYCDSSNTPVAQKLRKANKDFLCLGSMEKATLFGQHLFEKGGKSITITEGEWDAMSAFKMNGERYPVVSIKNGAAGALRDIKANWEYINSFETVVICFDNDEPGQKAAKRIAALFPKKSKIMKLDPSIGKDANDYLVAGKLKEFVDKWWRAETYSPEGIVSSSSLRDKIKNKKVVPSIPYPFQGLTEGTYGMRLSELVTVIAETGVGKTQVLREFVYNILKNSDYNVGGLFLEETPETTAEGLMSVHLNKRLHLPDTQVEDMEWEEAFNKVLASDRVWFYDHFGSNKIDTIINNIKYLAQARDCKFIFLDHISMVVSDQRNGDERKALDEITTKLKTLTMELDRDKTSKDELVRNTTIISVEKNRFSGTTGEVCYLKFDAKTGRLNEIDQETYRGDEGGKATSEVEQALNSFV
jgi:twinkle protein